MFIKRLLDIIISATVLIVLSPLMIIIYVLILINLGSPAFFVQERVGKDNKVFKMIKFRTMKDVRDKNGNLLSDNERVTKFGRFLRSFSLDELPELINIIKGDMSLVGPRPSLPKEVADFEPWMKERLIVQPGITCFWQVSGRNNIPFKEWMELDIKYVREMSYWLDVKLIFKTFFVLFGDENAS